MLRCSLPGPAVDLIKQFVRGRLTQIEPAIQPFIQISTTGDSLKRNCLLSQPAYRWGQLICEADPNVRFDSGLLTERNGRESKNKPQDQGDHNG